MYLLDEARLLDMPNLKAAMIPGSPILLNVHLSPDTYTSQPCQTLWFWGNKFSSLWGLTWCSIQIRYLWTICELGFSRKRLEKIWFCLHLKSIKGVGEKGSRLQVWVMTIIAWKNCVGGSSRRFKGKLRHSALYIILIQTQECKVLLSLFYFHVQERIWSWNTTRKSL